MAIDHERKVALMQKAVATFEDGPITSIMGEHVDIRGTMHRYFKDDHLTLCDQPVGGGLPGYVSQCSECMALMKRIRQVRGDEGRKRKAAAPKPVRVVVTERDIIQAMKFSELIEQFTDITNGYPTYPYAKRRAIAEELDRRMDKLMEQAQ